MKARQLKYITVKGTNVRIEVRLIELDKDKIFTVKTKRLTDFKNRIINETHNHYSVETFWMLKEMFNIFASNHEVKNKILLKEIAKIKQGKAQTNLK